MDKIPSILDVKNNTVYKETILDIMCEGILNTSEFRDCVEYILDNKLYLFEGEQFKGSLYPDEDEILTMILPLVRRVWDRIYIHPPSSFNNNQKEILKLYFDIDNYLEYVANILPWCKGLEQFNFIDKTNELLKLVVDNYIEYIKIEIHKLEKMGMVEQELLKLKRNVSLKKLLK